MALATGVKTSRPRLMSATVMVWPALTAAPLLVRAPAPGRVLMRTALSALAGLSVASVKPKFAATKV